jgi:hypothetical protein
MHDRRRRHDLHATWRRKRARGVRNGSDGWIGGDRMDIGPRREEHRRWRDERSQDR